MDSEGNIEEFDEALPEYAYPQNLIAGPDRNIWFAGGGTLAADAGVGKITPEGKITEYTDNLDGSRPEDIAFGSDGNRWYTGFMNPAIGFVTLDGEITDFPLPGQPWDLVEGPDGNIWFTYRGNGQAPPVIGRLEHSPGSTTVITFFDLNTVSQPDKIIASQNGYLWFLDQSETQPGIGRVSVTGAIKEFRVGLLPETKLGDLAAGPEGNVWFTDWGAGAVGRISPAGQITEFGSSGKSPVIHEPLYITSGPDGNMWFTGSGHIGKISPVGAITLLHKGLGPSSSPYEIVKGPGAYLSFLTSEYLSNAIGRILPGDDSPPAQPVEAPQSTPRIGRLVLQNMKARVSHAGRAHLRFSCQSSFACTGQLHLYVERRARAPWTAISLASFSITARTSARVCFKLNPMGRRLLHANSHMQVHLSLSSYSIPAGGPTTFLLIQLSGHRAPP